MKIKYFSLFLLGCLLAFPTGRVDACLPIGSASISGPSYCEDGVDAAVPARYEADVNINCSGCQSHTWELTGGTFVDAQNQPVLFNNDGDVVRNSFIKRTECGCKFFEFPNCQVIFGTLTMNDNDVIYVRWDPNAPVQELKLKAKEDGGSASCDVEDKLLYKRVSPPTSIAVNSSTCSSASVTAQIGSNDCRAPDDFSWYRNGSFIGTTSGPTRNVNISSTQNTTVEVSANYGVSESTRATTSIAPSIDWPSGITGSTILPEARPYFYNVAGTNGTVTQWMVSSNDVTITSTGVRSARLEVLNFFNGNDFTISARVERCGQSRWYFLDVEMDSNCSGPDCDFVRPGQTDGLPSASGTTMHANESPINPEEANSLDEDGLDEEIIGTLSTEWSSVAVFPNPVARGDYLSLQQLPERHEIRLFNAYGQLVQTLVNAGDRDRLSTQGLDSGLYFITVADLENQREQETIRVIIR